MNVSLYAPFTTEADLRSSIRAEVRKQIVAQVTEIDLMCRAAGAPHLIAAFIADGKTPEEVRAALANRAPLPGGADDDEISSAITTDASAVVSGSERYNPKQKAPDGLSLASMMRARFGAKEKN